MSRSASKLLTFISFDDEDILDNKSEYPLHRTVMSYVCSQFHFFQESHCNYPTFPQFISQRSSCGKRSDCDEESLFLNLLAP